MTYAIPKIVGLGLAILFGSVLYTNTRANSLRADQSPGNDGWNPCTGVTCASLAPGLQVNPLGADPSGTALPSGSVGGQTVDLNNANNPGSDLQACSTCSFAGSTAPAVSYLYGTTAQIVYFNLSGLTTVYIPSGTGVSNTGSTAWEVQFNYSLGQAPAEASLSFDGVTYTAPGSVLNLATFNEFVFVDNELYTPKGWTAGSSTTSAPELDTSSTVGALTLLAGVLLVMSGSARKVGKSRQPLNYVN